MLEYVCLSLTSKPVLIITVVYQLNLHNINLDLISQTGAMRLGKDALVLTQTTDSRSIAFLSHSLNEGKDVC